MSKVGNIRVDVAASGDVCLGHSGYFDRNSNEVDLMKFDLDELEQAAFEGDRDFAADRIVIYAESRDMTERAPVSPIS